MKKRILFFLIIFIYFIGLTNVSAETLGSYTNLESIKDNQKITYQNIINIEGWSISDSKISYVHVYLNGQPVGLADINISRPDVATVYPDHPNSANSGYKYSLDTTNLKAGTHLLEVYSVSETGKTIKTSLNFIYQKNSNYLVLDTPTQNQTFDENQEIIFNGWALNDTGFNAIQFYSNGKPLGVAELNLPRPDVAAVYPQYANGATSGYNFKINSNELSEGKNNITIYGIAKNGEILVLNRTITIYKKPSLMNVESVPLNLVVKDTNTLNIKGWSLHSSETLAVQIYLDGKYKANANINLTRPDVAKVYPQYLNSATSGFSYDLDLTTLDNGYHSLSIYSISHTGEVVARTISFYIERKEMLFSLETPINNSIIEENQEIDFKGWVVNDSGIRAVQIYVNGSYIGVANLNLSRPDVATVYPMYSNSATSGFSLKINSSSLKLGKNNIIVYAIAKDGEVKAINKTITVYKKPSLMNVETVKNNQSFGIQETLNIKGWTLHSSETSVVQIYLDGKYLGNATANLSRTDVGNVYPEYLNSNQSGFSYDIDLKNFDEGRHSLSIYSISKAGEVVSYNASINIIRKDSVLTIENPEINYVSNNQSFDIKGWFISEFGIKSMEVYFNNKKIGDATLGINRPDVSKIYPGYYEKDNSGFKLPVNVNTIAPGDYEIKLVATTNDGEVVTQTRTITIKKDSPLMNLESLKNGQTIYDTKLNIEGWAINASGIAGLHIYLDHKPYSYITPNVVRGDVKNAYPNYLNSDKSGFKLEVPISSFLPGEHALEIYAIGNDGTVQIYYIKFKVVGTVNYYDTGNTLQYYATKEGQQSNVSYAQTYLHMNPDEYINDATWRFAFLRLDNYPGHGTTAAQLNAILNKGGGGSVLYNKGDVFIRAGLEANVNPVYLVAHALLETGCNSSVGCSALSKGYPITQKYDQYCNLNNNAEASGIPNGSRLVYNMYGIWAYDRCAVQLGSTYAYESGWFSVDTAIIEGAKWIGAGYINNPTYQQNTLYKMRFNLPSQTHQYATDIGWVVKQTYNIKSIYDQIYNPTLVFDVPKFR